MKIDEAQAGPPGVKKYKVLSPLFHGGGGNDARRYEIGEEVWLTADQAGPLLGHTVKPIVVESAQEAVARRIAEKKAGG